mmetsp:Transcript_59823/g.177300  ORF Transcript_59823/g.177300 Transcript_59823/m.177300 type:complete len:91 (-) Transcript_59823:538-810(-)
MYESIWDTSAKRIPDPCVSLGYTALFGEQGESKSCFKYDRIEFRIQTFGHQNLEKNCRPVGFDWRQAKAGTRGKLELYILHSGGNMRQGR